MRLVELLAHLGIRRAGRAAPPRRVPREPLRAAQAVPDPPRPGALRSVSRSQRGPCTLLGHISFPGSTVLGRARPALRRPLRRLHARQPRCRWRSSTSRLPRLGVGIVAITGDLIVGFAYLFAGLGVLKAAGVSPSSVVTTSAVVSGVLALSMQATLGNILGGVALQLDGSIHVGDWVQLPDGTQGRVIAIRWRHTVRRDAQLGHDRRPQREPARAEHRHPRQAHRQARPAPDVGLLQRRLPLSAVARHRGRARRARGRRPSRAWPRTRSPASSATTSRRTGATASATTPCATG